MLGRELKGDGPDTFFVIVRKRCAELKGGSEELIEELMGESTQDFFSQEYPRKWIGQTPLKHPKWLK